MRRMSEKIKLFRHKPLVIIYGCTGTGKTKLSVELAKKYGEKAEIINADAMQVLN
jgi:tRNA A37 N6-isopentenylltransferase MiaA